LGRAVWGKAAAAEMDPQWIQTITVLAEAAWPQVVLAALVATAVATAVGYYVGRHARPPALTVKGLWVHPIKGCRGTSVVSAKVDRLGLEHDRRMMVIAEGAELEGATHTFVSQRDVARMATIDPTVDPSGKLHVSAPGMAPLVIDTTPPGRDHLGVRSVQVWKDVVVGHRVSPEADEWFTAFLGRPVELVSTVGTEEHRRPLQAKYFDSATTEFNVGASFADGYPMLVVAEASIADLNRRMPAEAVPVVSFRPNIVVGGSRTPWDEDTWGRVQVGGIEMALVKPCSRCQVPNVNQETGKRRPHFEPLRTLREFRGYGEDVFVGENAVQLNLGTISVGDTVTVLHRRAPRKYGKAQEPQGDS